MGVTELLSNKLFLESIYALIIVTSSFIIYSRSRKFFLLSNYRGIKYFSNAFLYFGISLLARYVFILIRFLVYGGDIPTTSFTHIFFVFVMVYAAAIGALYLAHSLVWKSFEKRGKCFESLLHIVALIVAAIENLLFITKNVQSAYFLLTFSIIILVFALIDNCCKRRNKQFIDPAFFAVIMSLSIFVVIFLGELFDDLFPIINVYTFGVVSIIYLFLLNYVVKITR